MELLGKRTQRLAEKHQLGSMYGDLSGLGAENVSLYAEDVADIPLLESGICLFAHIVSSGVYLDSTAAVLQVEERGFSHYPPGHDSSRNGDRNFRSVVGEVCDYILSMIRHIIGRDEERIVSFLSHCRKLIPADSDLFVLIRFLRLHGSVHSVLCHK